MNTTLQATARFNNRIDVTVTVKSWDASEALDLATALFHDQYPTIAVQGFGSELVSIVRVVTDEAAAARAEREARAKVAAAPQQCECGAFTKWALDDGSCPGCGKVGSPIRSMASIPVQTPAQAEAMRETFAEATARVTVSKARARSLRADRQPQPTFVADRNTPGFYSVFLSGSFVGTIVKRTSEYGTDWHTMHADGVTPGPSGDTRIGTTWAMINS